MARCVEKKSALTSELYLDNTNTLICARGFGVPKTDEWRKEVDLGVFPVGTELVFRLDVHWPPQTVAWRLFSGDPARNPDGQQHTKAYESGQPGHTAMGFEDTLGGGDKDFDDFIFEFWSVDP